MALKLKKRPKPAKTMYDDFMPVKAFRLARGGLVGKQLADALGISVDILKTWKREHSAFKRAIEEARTDGRGKKEETFLDYCFNRLSPDLQWLWKRVINLIDDLDTDTHPKKSERALRALLSDEPDEVLMNLFLHALVHYNFNTSSACRSVGVSLQKLQKWENHYPDFKKLVREILVHRKNLYEESLVKLVKQGDPSAILFANRTLNRDRGYSDKVEME